MNFNSNGSWNAVPDKRAKAHGTELRAICRGCERNGGAVGVDEIDVIDEPAPCFICTGPTIRFFPVASPQNQGVAERAFGVYFGRLREAMQTAAKGLAQ